MFYGYLSLGGQEIANAARTKAYVEALAPTINLTDAVRSDSIPILLQSEPFVSPEADIAPWYDEDDPDTADFYGAYPLNVTNLDSATTSAAHVEGITDGGFTLQARDSSREMLVELVLLGATEMAVNAGMTWLRAALKTDDCFIHGDLCDGTDFSFLAGRPDMDETQPDPQAELVRYWRYVHDVRETSGVVTVESGPLGGRANPCGFYAKVRFALTAGSPDILSLPRAVELGDVNGPWPVVEESPVVTNLVPHPSFSEAVEDVTLLTNLVVAPSAENGLSDWGIYKQGPEAGAFTNPFVRYAPFGDRMGRITWTTSPRAQDASGIRVAVAVEEGKKYAFRVAGIRSSIKQRLQLSIEWRDGAGFISGTNPPNSTFVAEAGRIYNKTHPSAIAPAGATSVWLRVHSAYGGSKTIWPIGSYLELDGVLCVEGLDAAPNFFSGDSVSTDPDVFYDWTGTRNDSRSRLRAKLPLGALTADQTFIGGKGVVYRSRRQARSGGSAAFYHWQNAQVGSDPSDFGQGGELSDLPVVVPGSTYTGSLYVRTNRLLTGKSKIAWYDAAGGIISETLGETFVIQRDRDVRVSVVGAVAPALASRAAVRFQAEPSPGIASGIGGPFAAGDWVSIDDVMLTAGSKLYAYFDGSSVDENQEFSYTWTGQAGSSPSTRVAYDSSLDDLLDPLLPAQPPIPTPPVIPNPALPEVTLWSRISRYIPGDATSRWATLFPVFQLHTFTEESRRVRVSLLPMTSEGSVDPAALRDIERSFTISYLPAESTITIDASLRRAWVQVAGGPARRADFLLYGNEGGPAEIPAIDEGSPFLLIVDVPDGQGYVEPARLELIRKE